MIIRRKKNGDKGDDVSTRLESMRSELDALREDMRGLLNDVGDAVGGQVQGAMESASESVQGAVDHFEEWSNESLHGMRKTVRERPLAACALSVGAGALLGAIFLRF
jgi:ElaB/YqjD/DUF883 family membrane-anchored ribosome-binding protein